MTKVELSLESIAAIDDGRIAVAFAALLKQVNADLADRPTDERARTVTLSATFKPVADETGECYAVSTEFELAMKIPNRRSRTYQLTMADGRTAYHSNHPTDIAQPTLWDAADGEA